MDHARKSMNVPGVIVVVAILAGTMADLVWLNSSLFSVRVLVAINLIAGTTILIFGCLVAVRLFRTRARTSGNLSWIWHSRPQWQVMVSFLLSGVVFNLIILWASGFRDYLALLLIGNVIFPFLWMSMRRQVNKRLRLGKQGPIAGPFR